MKSMHILLLSLAALCFTSCEYKDLCYDHSHVTNLNITYNWNTCPEANPSGMSLYFYDLEAVKDVERYDLSGRDGGTVRLPIGSYELITYNNDTEANLYRYNDQLSTIECYTRPSSLEEGTLMQGTSPMPIAAEAEGQTVALQPDPLWCGISNPFEMKLSADQSITITPQSRVKHISLTITDVPNLKYSTQFGGAISGMAGGVVMATGQLTEDLVILPFQVISDGVSTLTAEFYTFGHCPHSDEGVYNEHLLTIYVILSDGSMWYYTYDVSDLLNDTTLNPDSDDCHIELSGLPIPKPIVNGSGFKPDVDDWENEDIEVDM